MASDREVLIEATLFPSRRLIGMWDFRLGRPGPHSDNAVYQDLALATLYSDVLPLQSACSHAQSMSGVFSMASHSVLQYLPDVITHEQMGCAHL